MRALGDASDVERRLRAALKALTALEAELGEFKAKTVGCNFGAQVKSDLHQGHDCISRARVGIVRLLQRMKPDPVRWLEIAGNRDDGREAIKPLQQYCRDALLNLASVHLRGVEFMPANWEHRPLWGRVYEDLLGPITEVMRTADRSFIVASLQPRKGRS